MTTPNLVGILNLTPDSFSDGGAYTSVAAAREAIERMMEAGAVVIDIGAESTRPGAISLSAEEEWTRLEPLLKEALPAYRASPVVFSVDTRHVETARRALALGVHWINDVSGLDNPNMRRVLRDSDCMAVAMHSLTVPADPGITMQEMDAAAAVLDWATARIELLEHEGIARERLIIDPGIGFGKTAQQSWRIVRYAKAFTQLGVSVMVGHSRKSFLGVSERDAATLAVSLYLARSGVDYLRVHNVGAHAAFFNTIETLAPQ